MSSGSPVVVGIAGLKYHGKDTAAKVLINNHGFQRVSFADGVKKVVSEMLHVPVEWLHDPAKKELLHEPSGKTLREWMQLVGTEVGRNIWAPVWIQWWRDEIAEKGYDRVVATDMRFPNELEAIRKLGGIAVRVIRPSLMSAKVDLHESERYAMDLRVDADLHNTGSPEDLQHLAEMAFAKYLGGRI